MRIVGAAARRCCHPEKQAEAIDQALRIGEFRSAGIAPVGNETVDVGGSLHGFGVKHRAGCQATMLTKRAFSDCGKIKAVTAQENIPLHELIQAPDRTRPGLQPALMRTVLLRFAPLPAPLL
jgi:hypothetical protein